MDQPAIGSSGASVIARRPEIVPVAATVPGACERQDQHGNTSGPVVDAARFGMSCAAADRYTEGRHRVVVAALYSVLGVGLLGVGLLLRRMWITQFCLPLLAHAA